jgi:cysteine desulfurase
MWAAREAGRGNHLITSAIEHKAVLETSLDLRDRHGFDVSVVGVDDLGRVDPDEVAAEIRPGTVLISIMAASNEIGTIQPIQEIGALAREHGVHLHTDAVQAAAHMSWHLARQPIDLMSLSPHKFYGPKGFGILYLRRGLGVTPLVTGGGQEEGRRSGTSNVAFAVGAAEALRLAVSERENNGAHFRQLRDQIFAGVASAAGADCLLTGDPRNRLPNHASFAFRGLSGNEMLMHLDLAGISASSGSACLTGDPQPSAVLQALGLSDEWTRGGLRLTVGRQNTAAEVQHLLHVLPPIIDRMTELSGRLAV